MENREVKRLALKIAPFVAVVFLVGYIAGNFFPLMTGSSPSVLPASPSRVQISLDDDPTLGDVNAPVVLIEFIDFQCPFCRRFYTETFADLEDEYVKTGKVLFVVRDFPIESIHPSAQKSSEAVECADDQGMWREMHDKIFDEQNRLGLGTIQFSVEDLKEWAAEIGLDMDTFNGCLDSGKYEQEVQQDFEDGVAAGVTGTPYFFIGNPESGYISIVGAQPYSVFKQIIESELEN
ncbi:MAG: DsbA family protein [Nitrososphaerales archaeon]